MELHDRLESVFQMVFDSDDMELSDETSAEDIEEWDSVAHINLMFAIENAFGIQFAGNELAEFQNVGELKRYLAQRVA